ncbi:hypothetical protein GGX14DRAFT_391723 [Mycena pura]|uniref:Uncharacterized protein n=1 Tax=Mycena pura TaxID=153505 RepID=A0AAD6YE03_9AGAR|nr:hypothetical protein GGX14DRAFT_391723 [Mycena pura]
MKLTSLRTSCNLDDLELGSLVLLQAAKTVAKKPPHGGQLRGKRTPDNMGGGPRYCPEVKHPLVPDNSVSDVRRRSPAAGGPEKGIRRCSLGFGLVWDPNLTQNRPSSRHHWLDSCALNDRNDSNRPLNVHVFPKLSLTFIKLHLNSLSPSSSFIYVSGVTTGGAGAASALFGPTLSRYSFHRWRIALVGGVDELDNPPVIRSKHAGWKGKKWLDCPPESKRRTVTPTGGAATTGGATLLFLALHFSTYAFLPSHAFLSIVQSTPKPGTGPLGASRLNVGCALWTPRGTAGTIKGKLPAAMKLMTSRQKGEEAVEN